MYNTKYKVFFGRQAPSPRLLYKLLKIEEKP